MSSDNAAKIAIVIVTYRSKDTVAEALESLRAAVDSGFADCIVVENASDDGIGEFLSANYPWVRFIESPTNLGYGRGCNLGFDAADTPYVMFLNPDASIGVEDLRVMVDFMDSNPGVAIAGPSIVCGHNEVQRAGLLLTVTGLLRHALGREVYPECREIVAGGEPFRTSWISGAVMLVRATQFRELGGFDPRFFLYYEETDLCLRALRHGMEIWAIGQAQARHVGGVSTRKAGGKLTDENTGDLAEHYFASRFYYLGKNFGWVRAYVAELLVMLSYWARKLVLALLGQARAPDMRKRPFIRLPAKPAE